MKKDDNPFIIRGYTNPDQFCDRKNESIQLIRNMENNANTLLISKRRMGKTGLILHIFKQIKDQNSSSCLYLDLLSSKNLHDFINQLASAIYQAFPQKSSMGNKILKWIKNLSPIISYDPLSGLPQVSLAYTSGTKAEQDLHSIFQFMEQLDTTIIIAFDEFQQILFYPEKNIEAMLRSYIQHLHNVRFIFSGSSSHLLAEIFADSRRPFFASTSTLSLKEIEHDVYKNFIQQQFTDHKKNITQDAIEFILEWTMRHTYYTQYLCNRIYAISKQTTDIHLVQQVCADILTEQEAIYFQYRSLLTPIQWKLLGAIAKENKVYKPYSKEFIEKYTLGTTANITRALASLSKNDMVMHHTEDLDVFYRVYDVFLLRWLEMKT